MGKEWHRKKRIDPFGGTLTSTANSKYKPSFSTALKAVDNSLDERTTTLRIFKDSYKGPFLAKRGRGAVFRSSQKEYLQQTHYR